MYLTTRYVRNQIPFVIARVLPPLVAMFSKLRKPVREDELICPCTGMRFSDMSRLLEFLKVKNNRRFMDRIVKISGPIQYLVFAFFDLEDSVVLQATRC